MRKMAKTAAVLGCLVGGLLVNSAAQAGIITTIAGWLASGSVQDQDAIYTYGSSDLPGGTSVEFTTYPGPIDLHVLTTGALGSGPFSYTLNYTINLDEPSSVGIFNDVQVDSIVSGSGVTVTKVVRDSSNALLGTLTSTNGNPSSTLSVVTANLTELRISETIAAEASGLVMSVGGSYTVVPEPASLALLGLGGLALLRRRRVA